MSASERSAGLHVVLVQPEIPPNTGSIARLCAAADIRLHLVRPLGFSLDDRHLKRAGLDYWPYVEVTVHDDWAAFALAQQGGRLVFFTARAAQSYLSAPYAVPGPVYLVFGGESRGLPPDLVRPDGGDTYRIPIFNARVRSLNLANAVSIVVYEALRRRGALNGR